jgi:hypothetical protein
MYVCACQCVQIEPPAKTLQPGCAGFLRMWLLTHYTLDQPWSGLGGSAKVCCLLNEACTVAHVQELVSCSVVALL